MTTYIRFAHLADLHLGAWREKILTQINFETFRLSIDKIIENQVDFVLFAGDIFNTAVPPLDLVEKVTRELMRLKTEKIPLYVIGGSHDYSPLGKSFIQLLETAGVFIDVAKWQIIDKGKVNLYLTQDEKTKTILGGILGQKKGLDKNIYANLKELEIPKNVFSIFMFHCTLSDFKPEFMNAVQVETSSKQLPTGFKYYAGGHVHTHIEANYSTGFLSYPGPLFPNNFSELKRETPSFNICEYNTETQKLGIKRIFLNTYKKEYIKIEIDNLNPIEVRELIELKIENLNLKNKILLLEIFGIVKGKISEIKLQKIVLECYNNGAIQVLKNTYKLTSSLIEEIKLEGEDKEALEDELLKKELGENKEEYDILKSLLSLDLSKQEEEKVSNYEQRLSQAVEKVLESVKY